MLNLKLLLNANPGEGKFPRLPQQIWPNLIAIGLSVWLGACGVPYEVTVLPPASPLTSVETLAPTPTETRALPAPVQEAVFADLSQRTGQAVAGFQVTQAEPQTWPDGCLGLAAPDQFCTQMLVSGWRVTVRDGTRSWVYRTDANGSQVKPEP